MGFSLFLIKQHCESFKNRALIWVFSHEMQLSDKNYNYFKTRFLSEGQTVLGWLSESAMYCIFLMTAMWDFYRCWGQRRWILFVKNYMQDILIVNMCNSIAIQEQCFQNAFTHVQKYEKLCHSGGNFSKPPYGNPDRSNIWSRQLNPAAKLIINEIFMLLAIAQNKV